MKYFYPYFLLIILLAFACRPSSSSNIRNEQLKEKKEFIAQFDLEKIKKRGYLVAIMENSSTGLFIYRGKTMGYEYELLKLFCSELGVQLRINMTQNLKEAFNKLNTGEGDILAYNLTVTKERKKRIAFTHYLNLQKQVLIQRKPGNWRQMKLHEIESQLIRNPVDLIGKEVVVRPYSAYYNRLVHLSDEIGGDIKIVPGDPETETEQLIEQVAKGTISYTVAEEDIALVNRTYFPNLDTKTAISFPTQIAWGVRKNAPNLLSELNSWIIKMRKTVDYYVIYDKYFKSSKSALKRSQSKYSSIHNEGSISPYDSLIKKAAHELGWNWFLLSAQIFQESKFDPNIESWAGAIGLMQVLPKTAEAYGVFNLTDPQKNIYAGTQHLMWLQKHWQKTIQDEEERILFILASYNVGLGHLQDAVKLTKKYGGDATKWADVKEFLHKKSYKKYYTDPVVKHGYCRGTEPVQYVNLILDIYKNYEEIIGTFSAAEPTAPI